MNTNQWSIYREEASWVETNIEYSKITQELIKEGITIYTSEINKKPNTLILNPSNHPILFKIKNIIKELNLCILLESEVPNGELVILYLSDNWDDGETIEEIEDFATKTVYLKASGGQAYE